MPSHALHARWSRRICGVSLREVDRLIDRGPLPRRRRLSTREVVERYVRGLTYGGWVNVEIPSGAHDSSRMNCKDFMGLAERVYSEAGEEGLCVLILHHYLDKIPKLLRGLSRKILDQRYKLERCGWSARWCIVETLRGLLELEASVLFLLRFWDRLVSAECPECEVYRIIEEVGSRLPLGGLSRETRRRKRKVVEAVARTCAELDESRLPLIPVLRRVERRVRASLSGSLEEVVCDVIEDDARLCEWSGVATISELLGCPCAKGGLA